MYAVIETGGKQYKVSEGDVINIEKVEGDVGATIQFDRVLMFHDGKDAEFGAPVLDKHVISGEIIDQARAAKITVVKFQRRKSYMRKQGHRQAVTKVKITQLTGKTNGS